MMKTTNRIRKGLLSMGALLAVPLLVISGSATAQVTPQFDIDDIADAGDYGRAGEILLFPYYTVQGDYTTSFSIKNISERAQSIKLRWREYLHSEDVLDFVAVLSPKDVLAGYMELGPNGRPVVHFDDTTCRVPQLDSYEFPAAAINPDVPAAEEARLLEGHIEIIAMASHGVAVGESGYNSVHVGGTPRNCNTYTEMFASRASIDAAVAAFPDIALPEGPMGPTGGDVGAQPLIGNYALTDRSNGLRAGGEALALSDIYSDFGIAEPYLFAQSPESCDGNGAPIGNGLNDSVIPIAGGTVVGTGCITRDDLRDYEEWDHPHLGDFLLIQASAPNNSLGRIFEIMNQNTLASDWSVNSAAGVGIDNVLTFPTKYLYRQPPTAPSRPYDYLAPFDVSGCLVARAINVYDREEASASTNVTVSPGLTGTLDLCPEVNVFTYTPDGVDPVDVLRSPNKLTVSFTNLNGTFGWAELGIFKNTEEPWIEHFGFSMALRDQGAGAMQGHIVPNAVYNSPATHF